MMKPWWCYSCGYSWVCCTQTLLTNKPDSVVVGLSDGVTETVPFAVVVDVWSVVVAVVFSRGGVAFPVVVLLLGCVAVTFGPGVVNGSRIHRSSSCTTNICPFWLQRISNNWSLLSTLVHFVRGGYRTEWWEDNTNQLGNVTSSLVVQNVSGVRSTSNHVNGESSEMLLSDVFPQIAAWSVK